MDSVTLLTKEIQFWVNPIRNLHKNFAKINICIYILRNNSEWIDSTMSLILSERIEMRHKSLHTRRLYVDALFILFCIFSSQSGV